MQNNSEKLLSVGQVAKRAGVNVSTLHFYEQKGLIHSSRNGGNQRRYHKNVLRRIAVIKTAQTLGISLHSIHQALSHLPTNSTPKQKDWQKMSQQWQQELQQKIQQLTRLKDELDSCIGCGCLSIENCPLRNPEDILAKKGSGPVSWQD